MAKLLVTLEEDFHDELKELAHRKKKSMAFLVRYALEKTFEDELDIIGAELALEEAARDPESTMSWEEFKAKRARLAG